MSDFSIRSDSVDVEQIMRQIRARIRDKRGVDYTEQQIQELATAKLERFLDPTGVRSGLLEQYRKARAAAEPPPMYAFEDTTLFDSDKAIVRFVRRLLKPVLKLFFNYNTLSQTLHTQAAFNRHALALHENDPLSYELMHNLVLELTRVSIEAKNLKMRVESLQSRLEFNERRARALEGVVQYKAEGDRRGQQDRRAGHPPASGQGGRGGAPGQPQAQAPRQAGPAPQVSQPAQAAVDRTASPPAAAGPATEAQGGVDPITGGESLRTRRRRRRRRRAGGAGADAAAAAPQPQNAATVNPVDEKDDEPEGEIEGSDAAAVNPASDRDVEGAGETAPALSHDEPPPLPTDAERGDTPDER